MYRGIRGGKFLERRKLKNPQTGAPYQALDFFVGALLDVNSHKFRLVEADTFAAQYIQEHEEGKLNTLVLVETNCLQSTRWFLHLESWTMLNERLRFYDLVSFASTDNYSFLSFCLFLSFRSLGGQPPLSPASFRQAIGKAGLTLDPTSFNAVVSSFSMGNVVDGNAFLDAVDTR